MRAAIYEEFAKPLAIRDVPDPTPDKDGVVIKVRATGLCRSDWHGWMGHDPDIRLPHVPGHELAGEIAAVGANVTNWKVGDRVTLPFVCGCGVCPQCVSGNHQVCDHQFQPGFTHWGSFAEYVAIQRAEINLVRLPDELDFVTAASLGCRFVTSFRGVVDQGKVGAGQWVAVHGCGGVGLSAIMIANALGANVVAVDIFPEKLAFARSLGAVATVNARETPDVAEAVREITGGGAHVSIDALGSPATCFNSIASLRKRGKHIQIGLLLGDQSRPVIPMDRVIGYELEIYGSHGMQAYRYPAMLEMMRTGKLQPRKLVGQTISLDEAVTTLTRMDSFSGTGVTVIDRF
ncbi:MAG: zinc-dependent alcohol dehydrogenase family protein [Chloroflexi bacterium]|nr:zinc-dependent alcohol dehydrogenase family protein [Chloroflexota bacterium]OJV95973.1 MAG: alcohol dehydrogenase [Chloroflexi bacterium 54-19]